MKSEIEITDLNYARQTMPVAANLVLRLGVNGDDEVHAIAMSYLHEKSHRFSMLFTQQDKSWTMQCHLTHDLAVAQQGDCTGASRGWDKNTVATMGYMACQEETVIAAFDGREVDTDPQRAAHFSDMQGHLEKMIDYRVPPMVMHTHYMIVPPDDAASVKKLPRNIELLRAQKLNCFTEDFMSWVEGQDDALQFIAMRDFEDSKYYILGVSQRGMGGMIYADGLDMTVRCLKALDEAMMKPAMRSTSDGRRAFDLQKGDLLNYTAWQRSTAISSETLTQIEKPKNN